MENQFNQPCAFGTGKTLGPVLPALIHLQALREAESLLRVRSSCLPQESKMHHLTQQGSCFFFQGAGFLLMSIFVGWFLHRVSSESLILHESYLLL